MENRGSPIHPTNDTDRPTTEGRSGGESDIEPIFAHDVGERRAPVRRDRPRISPVWWFVGPPLVVLVATITYLLAAPTQYVVLVPGSARSVDPIVKVSALPDGPAPQQEPEHDNLLFLTVSSRQPTGIEALWRATQSSSDFVTLREHRGTLTHDQTRRFNLELMTNSKDKSAKVALERAGYEVVSEAGGAVIVDFFPDFPVADHALPGDTIVAADGRPVVQTTDLVDVIGAREPGEVITLTVQRLGEEETRDLAVELGSRPDDPEVPLLGVSLETRFEFELPFSIEIISGDVGGPSAGVAFGLAILDQVTEGNLLGEEAMAVTGTLEIDGSVGRVGGIRQKVEAALDEGATLFIVPEGDYEVAVEAARGRIDVEGVASFDEVLEVLEARGGDPVPQPETRDP